MELYLHAFAHFTVWCLSKLSLERRREGSHCEVNCDNDSSKIIRKCNFQLWSGLVIIDRCFGGIYLSNFRVGKLLYLRDTSLLESVGVESFTSSHCITSQNVTIFMATVVRNFISLFSILNLIAEYLNFIPVSKDVLLLGSDNLIPDRPNTALSCGQHGPVTAWFRSTRPGNVIPVPKTSIFLWSSSKFFGAQVRGFKPGRSRRIFRAKKSSARLPSEGK